MLEELCDWRKQVLSACTREKSRAKLPFCKSAKEPRPTKRSWREKTDFKKLEKGLLRSFSKFDEYLIEVMEADVAGSGFISSVLLLKK